VAEAPRLVLASASPRRRELLGLLGVGFEVRIADLDESVVAGESPSAYVERLARAKALAVAAEPDEVVIGSDTTVVVDGEILAKPADRDDAIGMLTRLSGRTHVVLTAVAVRRGTQVLSRVTDAEVTMAPIDPVAASWYVDTGETMDKAGGYALQGIGGVFVSAVHGSVQTVIGLPVPVVIELVGELIGQPGRPWWVGTNRPTMSGDSYPPGQG
jgi:septum formation protein